MKTVKRCALVLGLTVVLPFVGGYSYNLAGLAYDYTIYKVFVAE